MSTKYSFNTFIEDFRFGFEKNREALGFIIENRLWEGFWKFGWVMRLILLGALLAGWKMFNIFRQWYSGAEMDNVFTMAQSVGGLFTDIADKGYQFLFLSGFKYLVLILVEIIVFHFVRRTLEIKTGRKQDFTPDAFIKAQIRMIKIVVRNFILENIVTILLGIVLSIFGLDFLETALVLLVHSYFLGFTIIDNYNELFGMSIRQSARCTRYYPGLAIAVGLTTYFLLLMPIIGAFLAPFFIAVMATLAFHDLRIQEGDWRVDWLEPEVITP